MNERDAVAWLHRRAGFGLPPAQLRVAVERGAAAEAERLLDPAAAGAPSTTDLWDDSALPLDTKSRDARLAAVDGWLDLMVATERPLLDRLAWFWHGHFVSSLDTVRTGRLMVDQIRLFRRSGLGKFGELLRAVTIDPAMMIYLDLRTSTGERPNENYAREVLELFTLGLGNFTEDDVKAGARALTGWAATRKNPVEFVPRKHDDSPQTYLGVPDVHDLDTVVAAIVGHAAMPSFVAGAIAVELLGKADDAALVGRLSSTFAESGFDVRSLVRATVSEGLAGNWRPVVLSPVVWLVVAQRVTGARIKPRERTKLLTAAGQVPMTPPNVAGWPRGEAWFAAGSLVARANLAALVAKGAPDSAEPLAVAQTDDYTALADVLGLPSSGFAPDSVAALGSVPAGRDRLAVALVTPEFLIA